MKSVRMLSVTLVAILLFALMPLTAASAEDGSPDVEVLLDGSVDTSQTSDQTIAVQLDIIFHNMDWYNDQLYLSYHIYDSEGELLLFEGRRTLIENGAGGEIRSFPLVLNLADFAETKDKKEAVVTFDIVDEKNSIWFSDAAGLSFRAVSVQYDGHFPARMKSVLLKMLCQLPALLLNLAFCAAFALGGFFYRRSRNIKVLPGPFCQKEGQPLDRNLYERYFTASRYAGHGCLVCFRNTAAGRNTLAPFTEFFQEGLHWKVIKASAAKIDSLKGKKIDLCMFSGQEDVAAHLLQLEENRIFPKIICFPYQWTDYDALMAWSHKNHYRYDLRTFEFACIKRLSWVERMIY